jgi:prepilin-type N-terminal cleavage/methylation domain-containing protein
MRTRNAFTLIELLIVVAIIAILAAIAVPNLLEAQVRAKVSRAKSELRTLATGIEAYTVDNGRSPYDGEPGFAHFGWATSQSYMTTPIAYLSSLPADIFQDDTLAETARPMQSHFLDTPGQNNHVYDYSTAYWEDIINDPGKESTWIANFGYSPWKLTSPGPDLQHVNAGSFYGMRELYDPTNGTTSEGDIVRSAARTQQ